MIPILTKFFVQSFRFLAEDGPLESAGTGSPEGVVAAPVGSVYRRTDGGSGTTLYVKEGGAGTNAGWVAKGAGGGGGGAQQVFVQMTRPTEAGPWLWYETDASGNLVDLTINDGVA